MLGSSHLTQWQTPPPSLTLGKDEIHLWRANLALAPEHLPVLTTHLSAEEQARARRFVRQADAERYIAAHGLLRLVLSRYTGLPPADLCFALGQRGKPELLVEAGRPALRFNLSHSRQVALIAVRTGGSIGVDVEFVREDFNWLPVARRVLCPSELAALQALPEAERLPAFFVYWVSKEAYAKGVGAGLQLPPASAIVALGGEPPWPVLAAADGSPLADWRVQPLLPALGYVGAVAWAGEATPTGSWEAGLLLAGAYRPNAT